MKGSWMIGYNNVIKPELITLLNIFLEKMVWKLRSTLKDFKALLNIGCMKL